jgi:putative tryptophan/tyrosine transport system substrate-binding protein
VRRRDFIKIVAGSGAAAACPFRARAQQSIPVIGFIGTGTAQSTTLELAGFRQGLSEGGYVEGRDLIVEYRWSEGQRGRLSPLAADLVHHQMSVIVVMGNTAALTAKAATESIPIVFQVGNDPVASGLVASLARPGGNITGVTTLSAEIIAKRLELLHELVPAVSSIALLVNPANRDSENSKRNADAAAQKLGLQLHVIPANTPHEIDAAFKGLSQMQVGAAVVAPDEFFNSRSEQLAALALKYAVPTTYQYRKFAGGGGLMSYGADIKDAWRLVGAYAGRILKGAKPADLPVQQVTKVELIINLKTAKALGLRVPRSLAVAADEMIE